MPAPVLVVGPGALGLALAKGFRDAGLPVAVLGRDAASERRLASAGVRVRLPDGATRRVTGLLPARALKEPARLALLCVKAGDVARAAQAARRWIGPATAVVSLQNGVGHERPLRRRFGARFVAGIAYVAADRPRPGELVLNGGDSVHLARAEGNETSFEEARSLLAAAGFRVTVEDDEARMLWSKAAFNAAVNPLAAACAVENGKLESDPALRELALAGLAEAVAAAVADGKAVDGADLADKLVRACRAAPRQRNSMLQDLSAGRRTERTAILGPLLDAARRRAVPAPTLETLSAVVARLERSLAA